MSENQNPNKEEISEKEKRIRSITRLYYSNPKVQEALLSFAKDREVVPRYFEAFGKRPDTLQYNSDIMGLVNKGATSFHASEEIWNDPLAINSDMTQSELSGLRKSWDLLIDIDSPFLDYSKIAAILLVEELERHGINNYSVKYSGSKGFHLIVPGSCFPENFDKGETKKMFPEWPRAIVQYLMAKIKPKYTERIKDLGINFQAVQERMNLSEKDLVSVQCPKCNKTVQKSNFVYFVCEKCNTPYERPNYKITKKKIKCTNELCSGVMNVIKEEDYFFCTDCKIKLDMNKESEYDSLGSNSTSPTKNVFTKESKSDLISSSFKEDFASDKIASLDLVLVAPRHLFRMPYSLHEKTALSSIVLDKSDLLNFTPKDANPMKIIIIKQFYKKGDGKEAKELLEEALKMFKQKESESEGKIKRISEEFVSDFTGVTEEMFPQAIKILLKGLQEGRKRGLFILITFLKSLTYPDDYISQKVRDWNKKNDPPLKEGYVKSQLDWHFKQKKKILPPNYSNDSFYKDLKLISETPKEKNPLVEVARKLRNFNSLNQ
ncbi:MAG: hypothetical protein AABW89_04800 [Nanoarchaeota archaeon]